MTAIVDLDTVDAVRHVLDAVNRLDADAIAELPNDAALVALKILDEARRTIELVRRDVEPRIAEQMPDWQVTVEGGGVFKRHRKRAGKPQCLDEQGLWRLILDHRIFDPGTGEQIPQAEVIRLAYGSESRETGERRLTGVSPSKLEALGIDPEDWFEKADVVGYTIEVVA